MKKKVFEITLLRGEEKRVLHFGKSEEEARRTYASLQEELEFILGKKKLLH